MTSHYPPPNWAMLAVDFDEVEVIGYPCIGQPKLEGVRACWTGIKLISRQNKLFKEAAMPEIYAKLRAWSKEHPGIPLDGELYCHGMPFQDICARVAINRQAPHPDIGSIEFHAFDVISTDDTESRQKFLSQHYQPWVAVTKLMNPEHVVLWTNRFYESGFEGMMIRQLGCPYTPFRTEMLIKVKPWKYGVATITGFKEGQGKYVGMLGALELSFQGKKCHASGGLTDFQRNHIWRNQILFSGRKVGIKFRELSNSGRPLKPQIQSL